MNRPPSEFIRVREERLLDFVAACFRASGIAPDHAALIARLLVNNDLRGVRSHAARSAGGYCNGFATGGYNPSPELRVVEETEALVVIDGDGTLGYWPMVQAAEAAVAKARQQGVGVGLVRHIGHYGSAGHYARIALEAGCIGYSVQGYRHEASAKEPPRSAADSGNPPFCYAIPAGDEEAIVVDGGASFFSPFPAEGLEGLPELVPAAFFKSMGMIAVSTFVGGALTGFLGAAGDAIEARWPGAIMGGMVMALDIDRVADGAAFRREVDRYVRAIRADHTPLPGTDPALLPGAVEAECMRRYRREGIPLGESEQGAFRSMHERWSVALPWDD